MRTAIGIGLIIVGVIIGLYCGLYWAFIGGIIAVIEEIRTPGELDAMVISWNIARIVFSGFIGHIVGIIFIVPGYIMAND